MRKLFKQYSINFVIVFLINFIIYVVLQYKFKDSTSYLPALLYGFFISVGILFINLGWHYGEKYFRYKHLIYLLSIFGAIFSV